MKAIALVLAALSLSAGTAAIAEPIESVPMGLGASIKCGLPPLAGLGCTQTCVCTKSPSGFGENCEWVEVCR